MTQATAKIASEDKTIVEHGNVLEVRDLHIQFDTDDGVLHAVDGVSFDLQRGAITALVGESGCGKSLTASAILRLIQAPGRISSGSIFFRARDGRAFDLASISDDDERLYQVRGGSIGMIFQEPMTALSPVHSIGNQMIETIRLHQHVDPKQARQQAIAMLRRVGITRPEERIDQYSFEFSGGMRQRVMIALSLVNNPEILIADEPTTALDVTIQAQVLGLIKSCQRELNTSVLLITHDFGVVAQMADQVAVMYLGRIVEFGEVRSLIKNPQHPYTIGLMRSLPEFAGAKQRLQAIPGSVPSLHHIPKGCAFHPRCAHAQAGLCNTGDPPLLEGMPGMQKVACHLAGKLNGQGTS